MISETNTFKLIEVILLNAYAVRSPGLYNGKAGLSICLFETAGLLKDSYVEDHAFELLQEALVSKTSDIGFENGLSGIGYALHYLINYNYVDADFYEFFGGRLDEIRISLANLDTKASTNEYVGTLHLFNELYKGNHAKWLEGITEKIVETICSDFNGMFKSFHTIHGNVTDKLRVLEWFKKFLKLCSSYAGLKCVEEIVTAYSNLYLSGKVASDFTIGFYLSEFATICPNKLVSEVARMNMELGLKNIHPEVLPLYQRLNLLFLLRQQGPSYSSQDLYDLMQSYSSSSAILGVGGTAVSYINPIAGLSLAASSLQDAITSGVISNGIEDNGGSGAGTTFIVKTQTISSPVPGQPATVYRYVFDTSGNYLFHF